MNVLAILGSPRRDGNAEILLDQAIAAAQAAGSKTEKIILNELKFVPCQECGGCNQTGKCVIKDDMRGVYQKVDQADKIILASPIFFGSLPAQVKAMIDRCQCRWIAKYVLKQKQNSSSRQGALILVSGSNQEKFFNNAESIVKNWFAVLGVKFSRHLYCPQVDQKAEILKHKDCLEKSRRLGKAL